MERTRCGWCTSESLYREYHDHEWGVPQHDEQRLFEFLVLEGAQAGLSWLTILRKREGYRRCFANFDPTAVAGFSDAQLEGLLQDEGIVRNRLKVWSVRDNACAFLEAQRDFGSFDAFLDLHLGSVPRVNHWATLAEVPAVTPEAEALSKALKKRGFHFVGPTIMYAFMQAIGRVDDHVLDCWKRQVANQ